ncbi:hypothetical protein RRG08_021764 [Elysia crispata]|uniref:Uncharacterized protein n=1 Tax=Elysia crispata TaxID=231223 RepID=A0AAE0ZXR6_9GAST|nr:hypothetical protein RRG08_021764 [Elysia crispata]
MQRISFSVLEYTASGYTTRVVKASHTLGVEGNCAVFASGNQDLDTPDSSNGCQLNANDLWNAWLYNFKLLSVS